MGTASHNTVMVENHSQMLKGNRFVWYYWTQAISAELFEVDDEFVFEGKISSFRFLNPKASHKRRFVKKKNSKEWEVIDEVCGLNNIVKFQIWHHDENPIVFKTLADNKEVLAADWESHNSSYYGRKEKGKASAFQFDKVIKTKITIN